MKTHTVTTAIHGGTLHAFVDESLNCGTIASPAPSGPTMFDMQDLVESIEDRLDGELTQRAFTRACDSPRVSLDQLRSEVK